MLLCWGCWLHSVCSCRVMCLESSMLCLYSSCLADLHAWQTSLRGTARLVSLRIRALKHLFLCLSKQIEAVSMCLWCSSETDLCWCIPCLFARSGVAWLHAINVDSRATHRCLSNKLILVDSWSIPCCAIVTWASVVVQRWPRVHLVLEDKEIGLRTDISIVKHGVAVLGLNVDEGSLTCVTTWRRVPVITHYTETIIVKNKMLLTLWEAMTYLHLTFLLFMVDSFLVLKKS